MTVGRATQDRRSATRIEMGMQITVYFTLNEVHWTETDATLVDLSSAGMFIRCDRMPKAGQHILVSLLHHEKGVCAAWGQTVRFDGWGGFGVRLDRINQPLSDFVELLGSVSTTQRGELMADALDAQVWIDSDDPF